MSNPTPLWPALGCPAWQGLLPVARSAQWRACRERLLVALGGQTHDIPTPTALWRLAHDGHAPPRGATWAMLCAGATLEGIAAAQRHQHDIAGQGKNNGEGNGQQDGTHADAQLAAGDVPAAGAVAQPSATDQAQKPTNHQ